MSSNTPRWLRWGVVGLICFGAIFGVVLAFIVFVLPGRADSRFRELRLGDGKSRVEQLLGSPRRITGPNEIRRYRGCELSKDESEEVFVYTKGIDRLFIVGFRDDRVAAKCSVAM